MSRDITVKQLRIVTAVCAFSFSIAQVNAQDQFLVDKGKAYAEIIISESPAWLAATELQTYIAKISDQRLPGSESGHFFSTPSNWTAPLCRVMALLTRSTTTTCHRTMVTQTKVALSI